MMTRDKKIGKSIYRIKKADGRFRITETYLTQTAYALTSYRTMEEALQTLAIF